jgi:hypothetical protein
VPGASSHALLLATIWLLGCSAGNPAAPGTAAVGAGAAGAPAAPTWFRDVEPIVQTECSGCHASNDTAGFALDRSVATSLASILAERVAERLMPPWPPGPSGAEIASARRLDERAVATVVAWEAAGSPAGDPRDHVERAARAAALPAGPPDLHLELPAATAYREPPSPFVTDEIRCFVLDWSAPSTGAWVTASRWRAGAPAGVRTLGGVVLDGAAAAAARARSGRDGRAGFECGGGLGDLARGPALGASGTGGPSDGASVLPAGAAVRVPASGAVLMRVHYAAKHLALAPDRSGVDLWLADEAARRAVRPLLLATVTAPVEVPCPSGVSLDAKSPCSREGAFARLAGDDAPAARARADQRLASCGTTLAQAAAGTRVGDSDGDDHFMVHTSCTTTAPFDGALRIVEAHLQTHGASVRVEAELRDGTWTTVLDIPRWQWAWEGTYLLARGVPIERGRRLRVSCIFDNGTTNQWSALTGEAGHDGAARPPHLLPSYLVAAPHRAAEACSAAVGIERAPHRQAAWPTLCHEAEAVVAEICGARAVDLVSRGCDGDEEDRSVAALGASTDELRTAYCPNAAR